MSERIDRRRFFRNGMAASAVIASGSCLSTNLTSAIEPITRNEKSKFKFSLAAYSYESLLTGSPAKLTLTNFVDDCAEMGLEGTELTSYYFPETITHNYLRTLKQRCFKLGLDVSGTAVGNDFGHPAGEERQQQIVGVKQWIDYAEILGAPVIRIFSGHVREGMAPAQAHSLMVSAMEECCDYAGQHGVHLALENHGGPTATADGLLALVRDVKSPWFGVNLDTGNFHSHDIYGEIAKVAPYALNVQVKVMISGPDEKRSPSDFKRLATIFREANYRGYIVLEYEESGDPRTECPKHVDQLREAFVEA
jgi:sugar phosphate isomerase/epimerase